jgi:hypothetical protein
MGSGYPSNPADKATSTVIPQLRKVRCFGQQAVILPEKHLTVDGQLFYKTIVVGHPNPEGIIVTADVHFTWPDGDQVSEINGTVMATRPNIRTEKFHYVQEPSQTRDYINIELLEREITKARDVVSG